MTLQDVLSHFPQHKKVGDYWMATCSAHDDRVASLSIRENDGKILLNCHAGCAFESVIAAANLEAQDLFEDHDPIPPVTRTVKAVYPYTDEQGQLLFESVRYEPKDFRQRRPDPENPGGYLWSLGDTRRVVYRLHEIQGKPGVLIVEGEADVDAATALGLPATTNCGGANKWSSEYTKQLKAAGVVRAVIMPDNDVPGRTHAIEVATSLTAAGIQARLLILPDLPPKGDLRDYLKTHTEDELRALLKDTQKKPVWTPEAAAPPPPPEPLTTFQRTPEGKYVWAVIPPGVMFELERVHRDHGELLGELTVRSDITGIPRTQDGALMTAAFNLSSARARQERAKLLATRAKTKDVEVDWFGMLEEFCERVHAAERGGAPAIRLDEGPVNEQHDATVVIDGVTLLTQHPVILFGDGGSAKSYLGLYLAGRLSQQGMRVLYADWELLPDEHKVRLYRLFGADRPQLWYVSCERPLVAEQDRLRQTIRAHNISYMVVDSIAVACDGPPEAAEVTTSYFRSIRSLGVGSIHLAHTNKSEQSDRKPFGSSFWHNLARATWFCQRSDENEDAKTLTVALFNRKANLGPLQPAVGFTFSFDQDRASVRSHDIRDRAEFAGQVPLWQRIKNALERGPKTTAALADELEAKEGSIRQVLKRHTGIFERNLSDDGIQRIRLVKG